MADENREQTQSVEDNAPSVPKDGKNETEDAELNELLDSMYLVNILLV